MASKLNLRLERRDQPDETGNLNGFALFTPPVSETYWAYRVCVSEGQAVLGFPKFGTIGIGFAVEEDWNTNLPFTCETQEIVEHIARNAGSGTITRDDIAEAVQLIQQAASEDHPEMVERWNRATDGTTA